MKKWIKTNEEGSVLVSVVLFIYLSALLLTGTAYLVKNQVTQYQQIKRSYEAKSMLEFSEKHLRKELEKSDAVKGGLLTYSNGTVLIESEEKNMYELSAELSDRYKLSKKVIFLENEKSNEKEELADGATEQEEEKNEPDQENNQTSEGVTEESAENPKVEPAEEGLEEEQEKGQ